jgi:1,4-alpha-glucan branching enzyme/maltooligosyltrehalose trehalohydrolase
MIADHSSTHILTELAHQYARPAARPPPSVLESDANQAKFLGTRNTTHNGTTTSTMPAIVLTRGPKYYVDYQRSPAGPGPRLDGFVFKGDFSAPRRCTRSRRAAAADAFIAFLQNHDQVGNRAFGERLAQLVRPELLKAAASILLLSPQVPLLFMGEEWASAKPFQFFCDFGGALAQAVRDGRRREFARFPAFADPGVRDRIPDPNDVATFERSKLAWAEADRDSHADHIVLSRAAGGPPACNHSASRRHPCRDARHQVTNAGLLRVSGCRRMARS